MKFAVLRRPSPVHRLEPLEARIAPAFAAVFEVASLNGTNGFRVAGANEFDTLGSSVSDAGDINKDGFGDLIIGASGYSPGAISRGAAYVLFGKAGGFTNNLDLNALAVTDGFRIEGVSAEDMLGASVSAAGDVNGDGIADLVVGAPQAADGGTHRGAVYVLYGKTGSFGSTVALGSLNGTTGFKISTPTNDTYLGESVSSAGDVNHDGIGDLIIGAPQAAEGGPGRGVSYVIFGHANNSTANLSVASLTGGNGFKVSGLADEDHAGQVSGAGDLNGDGFDDVVIGAYGVNQGANSFGAAYVIFGKATGFGASVSLASLNGMTGFKLSGASDRSRTGDSVSGAGDLNGDGFADLVIGAPLAKGGGTVKGEIYVVFGKSTRFAADLSLKTLGGRSGFTLHGVDEESGSGASVSAAGDVNGDGFDDLLIGAPYAGYENQSNHGAAFVVYGKNGLFPKFVELASLDGSDGFQIHTSNSRSLFGKSVSAAGDLNKDGFNDVVIGATNVSGDFYGRAYVVFGQGAPPPPPVIISTSGLTATFTEADGDLVTVTITKGKLKASDFGFSKVALGQRLQLLDLHTDMVNGLPEFAGSNVTILAKPGPLGGDGFVALGYLNATGVDLGTVNIDGDVGQIDAGNADLTTPAAKSLTVQSLGRSGASSQASGGSLVSNFQGALGALTVKTDVVGATVQVSGGVSGQIGAITITGSLLGNLGAGGGSIQASGKIGAVKIGRDLLGGNTMLSGALLSDGAITSVTVGGSLAGGSAPGSGSLQATGGFGAITITGEVRGGNATDAGSIITGGPVKIVTIGRDLIGGSAPYTGAITTHLSPSEDVATLGPITIKGSLLGGTHALTGILGGSTVGAVKITGDVRGTTAGVTAKIIAEGLINPATAAKAVGLTSVTVSGSVRFSEILAGYSVAGGSVAASNADVQIGAVTITGDWEASSIATGALANGDGYGNANDALFTGAESATIVSRIAGITIKGALYGTATAGDHYGFVSEQIGKLMIGKGLPPITDGHLLAPVTDDVRVRLLT